MTNATLERPAGDRWGAVAGIAFVVLFVVGFFLYNTPDSDAADAEWVEHFAESGNRVSIVVGAYLLMLAGLVFLVFATTVRQRIRDAGHVSETLGALSLVSAAVYAVIQMLAAFFGAIIALATEVADVPLPDDPDLLRTVDGMFFGTILVPGLLTASLFVAVTSAGAARGATLPRWLVVAGYVVAVLLLFGAIFFPLLLWLLWVLAVSIALLVRGRSPTGTVRAAQRA